MFCNAQNNRKLDGIVEFDKLVHDFGDILIADGPVSCTYTVTNIGNKPLVIYNVSSSCGCTAVDWTRQPLKPGEKGTIKATFNNEDGPYPFDKTLTVYISGVKKPFILHLKGYAHNKKLALNELYNIKFGSLAFREIDIKAGNMSQGESRSGEMWVANVGKDPINVSFSNVSQGLKVAVSPNPIPAGKTAKFLYTVTADRNHWGKNYYYAVPIVNNKSYPAVISTPVDANPKRGVEAIYSEPNPAIGEGKSIIGIYAFTKEDFSNWTETQRQNGSHPTFEESSYSFGKVKAGEKIVATYTMKNEGKSLLKIYKFDSETYRATCDYIPDVKPGEKASFKVNLDTTGLPKGESLLILSLTTNSPDRPLVNLFLAGWIE